MATATTAQGNVRATAAAQGAAGVNVNAPSRREFLYYIWGASIALLLGQATAGIIWFALPRFKEGTFGGIFVFPLSRFPTQAGAPPSSEPAGRFHVIHTPNDGLLVLFGVCTHLGCLPKWQEDRFACPCHGSQYTLTGNWIKGPAPRGLDMFKTTVTFDDGTTMITEKADSLDGSNYAILLKGKKIAKIDIDTGTRIKRPNH